MQERANLQEERDAAAKAAARAAEDVAMHRRRIGELEANVQVGRLISCLLLHFHGLYL